MAFARNHAEDGADVSARIAVRFCWFAVSRDSAKAERLGAAQVIDMEFLVILMLSLALPPQSAPRDRVQDDEQVVSAVLTQTVRREVDKLLARPDGWRGSPVVILL